MRVAVAGIAGGLFGAGLFVSGMTDTARVQGWLDVLGPWDATLTFVMGGAILPMAVAWRLVARRRAANLRAVLGGALPGPAGRQIDARLAIGAVLFGMGWALAGLCPGPALASLSFGGAGGVVFLLAMVAGMVAAPALSRRIETLTTGRSAMDIRALTPVYAVSPQIDLSDLQLLKAAGYTTIIDNRPDGEIPGHLQAEAMQEAAEALGLTFVVNPVLPGAMTEENIAVQRQAMDQATGPVFAYCASGNRSSVVWMMINPQGLSVDDLIATTARFGYNHAPLRAMLQDAQG
jgi:uncharacterized protein (TIGR01244 family)